MCLTILHSTNLFHPQNITFLPICTHSRPRAHGGGEGSEPFGVMTDLRVNPETLVKLFGPFKPHFKLRVVLRSYVKLSEPKIRNSNVIQIYAIMLYLSK